MLTRTLLVPFFLLALGACATEMEDEEALEEVESNLSGPAAAGATFVTTARLNLRATASTSAKVLATMPLGATVTAVETAPKAGFYHVTYEGKDGWASGMYLKATAAEDEDDDAPTTTTTGGPSAQEVLAKLSCKKLSSAPYATDGGGKATVDICGTGNAVFFKADMDIVCDGKQSSICNKSTDTYYQSQTAGTDSKGGYLDAAKLPFIVVPGVSSRWSYRAAGIKMGSIAAVIYNGKIEYGIVGDVGPTTIVGEASYAMARRLGINSNPNNGGTAGAVTYVIFKDTTSTKNEDHATAVRLGQARARRLVDGT